MAYARGNSVPHANLAVLDKLIAARHELAKVGYIKYIYSQIYTLTILFSSYMHVEIFCIDRYNSTFYLYGSQAEQRVFMLLLCRIWFVSMILCAETPLLLV